MTRQEETLAEIARGLERLGISYMVIGGLANAVWGEPRSTLDIDLTIAADTSRAARISAELRPEFEALVEDPQGFVEETRVLPLESRTGVRVDLVFGLLPFELEAIDRATRLPVADTRISFCTAEDLILLKIVSTRERDRSDVRGILRRRLGELDLDYLEPRIEELADLLSRPQIARDWSAWKAEAEGDT